MVLLEVDVQGQMYYMMFRKDEARDAYQKPFDEEDVRRNVERKVEREKRQALMDEWIRQLRERAEVKTYIDRTSRGRPPRRKRLRMNPKQKKHLLRENLKNNSW